MTIAPSIASIITDLRSVTPLPLDNRRKPISGCLLGISGTVFLLEYNYNGTIIDFVGRSVIVLPNYYGPAIHRLPRIIRAGQGISCHQRWWLDIIHVGYHD